MNQNRQPIEVRTDGEVIVATINRPDRMNALDAEACAALGAMLDRFEADRQSRVCVVTGAGDKAFCAGFDLQYAESHPEVYDNADFGSEIVRRPQRSKPVIAAVNGLALGLGFELALACDLIVASPGARFGLPEPSVGLAAMGGGIARLVRELGPKRALAMILTGDLVAAAEAVRLGFVNAIAERPVVDEAMEWAARIARGAPLSIATSLEIAYRSADLDLPQALDPNSYTSVGRLLGSSDAREGRQAFLQRRRPQWRGE